MRLFLSSYHNFFSLSRCAYVAAKQKAFLVRCWHICVSSSLFGFVLVDIVCAMWMSTEKHTTDMTSNWRCFLQVCLCVCVFLVSEVFCYTTFIYLQASETERKWIKCHMQNHIILSTTCIDFVLLIFLYIYSYMYNIEFQRVWAAIDMRWLIVESRSHHSQLLERLNRSLYYMHMYLCVSLIYKNIKCCCCTHLNGTNTKVTVRSRYKSCLFIYISHLSFRLVWTLCWMKTKWNDEKKIKNM